MMTYTKVAEGKITSSLEPEVEFRRQSTLFRIPFLGHISAADQDWCLHRKWGAAARGMVNVQLYTLLEYPRWRTAAILNYLNRYKSAANRPIWLKFCTVTHMKVPKRQRASSLEPEVQFCRQRAFFEFRFWVISPPPIKISSPNLVKIRLWGLATCGMVHVCLPQICKIVDSGQVESVK